MPTLSQMVFQVRTHGLRGVLARTLRRYAYGREQWYVVRNELSGWSPPGLDPDGLE